ncbi:DeSI-like protein [Drosera capensis]
MAQLAGSYSGDSYHLINNNCNHFCQGVCYKLTGKKIPMWVNRLAKLGSACRCVLPETLTITRVQDDGNLIDSGTEKSHLRSSCTSLSSISIRHRQISASSTFLCSSLKSCLPLYEWGGLKYSSLKER